ncbi:hypothetical protein JCM8202v2_000955 [Rhodotorula sphaerocarpa]
MASTVQLSLEPSPLIAGDGLDDDLFARPARLQDLNLDDGREVLTRADNSKSLHERLMRLWAERGDFSQVTEDSIRNPAPEGDKGAEKDGEDGQSDGRPAVEDIRKLQETMIYSLALVRGELTTALDLLSVLSAPTDPPDVDVNSIPLPQQTLTLVPTAVPARPSSDPTVNPLAVLPLATSLTALKSSANAFFRASEELIPLDPAEQAALALVPSASAPAVGRPAARAQTRAPDPWPTIMRLHASSARPLVPLGAAPGASLTGKGETRTAKQVGVVYGYPEARAEYRRAAVARVGDLVEEAAAAGSVSSRNLGVERPRGRSLVLELNTKGTHEAADWCGDEEKEGDVDPVERILRDRARSALAEELFAQLMQEARSDSTLRAELVLASGASGDAIRMKGNGWELSLRMSRDPPARSAQPGQPLATIGPLLRLFFLQTYTHRRSPRLVSPPRPGLASISALLNHQQRVQALEAVLDRQVDRARAAKVRAEVDWADDRASELARSAELLLDCDGAATALGHVYHITHSHPIPSGKAASGPLVATMNAGSAAAEPTLVLRPPGRAPISVPSVRLLEQLLDEQVSLVLAAEGPKQDPMEV